MPKLMAGFESRPVPSEQPWTWDLRVSFSARPVSGRHGQLQTADFYLACGVWTTRHAVRPALVGGQAPAASIWPHAHGWRARTLEQGSEAEEMSGRASVGSCLERAGRATVGTRAAPAGGGCGSVQIGIWQQPFQRAGSCCAGCSKPDAKSRQ